MKHKKEPTTFTVMKKRDWQRLIKKLDKAIAKINAEIRKGKR